MTPSRASLTLLAALLLATSACVPVGEMTTRQSSPAEGACAFTPDTCADLPRTRASVR